MGAAIIKVVVRLLPKEDNNKNASVLCFHIEQAYVLLL